MGCLLGIGAAAGAATVWRIVRLFSAAVTRYVLAMTDEDARIAPLDDEARAAIREGLEQARRGEFVPESEIEAIWKRFGVDPKPEQAKTS
jgi:predicted transcriptional regulator